MDVTLTTQEECCILEDGIEMLIKVYSPFPTLDCFNAFKDGQYDSIVAIFHKYNIPIDKPLNRDFLMKWSNKLSEIKEEDEQVAAMVTDMMETYSHAVESMSKWVCHPCNCGAPSSTENEHEEEGNVRGENTGESEIESTSRGQKKEGIIKRDNDSCVQLES